ncbi:type VI secretion system baseplate subunit TssK [Massilia rhizosphaerae]|uniref:type VI secretion system baseplate subunit TssK n=1 Tax=Massilia rhizosphaerae TaxID=2784389 RepID=UPI0018DBDA30|nr:type VI secretion system baseplate subunit TssK [Massilia rhizosphaerae]
MSLGAKILWSEGLTLGPQHFQRQDLYHETRLLRMASALNPHFWGVRQLQWNMDALGHDLLEAQAMSLIFQDGEVYEAPATDLLPVPVDLTRLPQDINTFTIHAALPTIRPHGANAEEGGRYALAESETADLFSDAVPIDVPFLKKRVRLLTQAEPRDGHVGFPVLRIHRDPRGGFDVDPAFVPPCVAIGAARPLQQLLDGLMSALTAKIVSLHNAHRKTNASTFEVHAGDITSWWMLNIISTANASLQHYARSRVQHPEDLYEKLLALAGGLMTFSDRYATVDLPAYVHADPGVTFAQLDAVIRELVDTVISARYFTIPLVAEDNRRTHYRGVLDPSKLTQETQLCLAVSAAMPALELVAAVPVRFKIGSPDDIERIVASALPGIALTHMPQVPAAVPVRPDTYYFLLSTRNGLYENALKAQAIAIYAPAGMLELKIELIAFTQ